jgi:hypothetical protein
MFQNVSDTPCQLYSSISEGVQFLESVCASLSGSGGKTPVLQESSEMVSKLDQEKLDCSLTGIGTRRIINRLSGR